ncbi:MAG: hypothetical protein GWO07_00160 [Candidatus Dadabacteria bacterium]|nr:hypothetical protein [Candidatus Dadabacteria bacterium]
MEKRAKAQTFFIRQSLIILDPGGMSLSAARQAIKRSGFGIDLYHTLLKDVLAAH